MTKKHHFFEFLLAQLSKSGNAAFNYAMHRYMMQEQFRNSKEQEQLEKKITENVLARLHTTLDTQQASQEIDKLKKQIDNMFKQ